MTSTDGPSAGALQVCTPSIASCAKPSPTTPKHARLSTAHVHRSLGSKTPSCTDVAGTRWPDAGRSTDDRYLRAPPDHMIVTARARCRKESVRGLAQPALEGSRWILWTPEFTPSAVSTYNVEDLRKTRDQPETPAESARCPQSDSNRHLTDFKSVASADWAMGATDELSASTPEPDREAKPLVAENRVLKIRTPR